MIWNLRKFKKQYSIVFLKAEIEKCYFDPFSNQTNCLLYEVLLFNKRRDYSSIPNFCRQANGRLF